MDIKSLLDQFLQSSTQQGQGSSRSSRTEGGIEDKISSLVSGKGVAALAGGAIGLLLGSKTGRKMGGKVLTYGGLAILGTLAYKAYQNHQKNSSNANNQKPNQPLEFLQASSNDARSKAILIALIAAAKSDGHIDDREMQLIEEEVSKFSKDESLRQWFLREVKKPLDPAEVASHSSSPAMASEIYLASLLAIDQQNFMEKSYLDELARQLKLEPALQIELSKQAQFAIEQA